MTNWTHEESEALYNVPNWGQGYFRINDWGNVEVLPEGHLHPAEEEGRKPAPGLDLNQLLAELTRRGIETPILLRFDGILRSRVRDLCLAFENAREEFGYAAAYRPVFPIKVNQERHVVEALLEGGRDFGMGLEAGSKPELLAVIALRDRASSLVICNGYKDREYIETAMLASKLGIEPVIVVEKFSEVHTIIKAARKLDVKPLIGVRAKLWGVGSGRWMESGGDRSKFGLTARQVVNLVELLREEDMLDSLVLLHFHLGSQVTHIRSLKSALREATRTFLGIHEMGARLRWLDVGGGLGVDYDGSSTDFESSMNYSLQEYANDVVYQIATACREGGIDPPEILSESGRALTAHHAVLVTEVLGVSEERGTEPDPVQPEEHPRVREMAGVCRTVSEENYQEAYHDSLQIREEAMVHFNVGQLSLEERARVEEFFWHSCRKISLVTRELEYVPDDLDGLERDLSDTYFLNFSVFQSMPDSWAISQLFPVLPIHRHKEEPTKRAVLADITCDSDGKIDRFIALRDVKRTLEVHSLREGEPYYLGHFLVGAYQEILGDMHNLFGDTNVVHVDAAEDGRAKITHIVPGDRVKDVLAYVEYFENDLVSSLRRRIEAALDEDRLTFEESALLLKRYESGLSGYTYLTRETES